MSLKNSHRFEAVRDAFVVIQQSGMHGMADEWIDSNLTMAQVKALYALQRLGTVPVGTLADKLRTGLPAASLIADRLVQAGLVERREDRQDRRRTLLKLTSRGSEHVLRLQQGRRDFLESLLARMSDEDFSALLRGISALAGIAQEQALETRDDRAVARAAAGRAANGD